MRSCASWLEPSSWRIIMRDVRQRLLILIGSPAEIAPGQRGFNQIFRSGKLAVEVQERRPGMRLKRSHHVHGLRGVSVNPPSGGGSDCAS